MFKKVLLIIVLVLVVLAIVIARRPAQFQITRSIAVAAPPSAVFAQVNDFHKWEAWSPWAKLDPAMRAAYDGPYEGPGAIYSWSGNSKVGEGRMTILESRPNEAVRIQLEFLKPFAATNTAEFTFKPDAKQTLVTWTMYGTNQFMSKAFDFFMNMDKMVGADFEKGLAQMKVVAESTAQR